MSTPLTDAEIAELRRLDKDGPPAPWRVERPNSVDFWIVDAAGVVVADIDDDAPTAGAWTEDLIAAARNAIPRLLDEVTHYRELEQHLLGVLRPHVDRLLPAGHVEVRAAIDALAAESVRARALLKRIEWTAHKRREGADRCPECGGLQPYEDAELEELDDGSWRRKSDFISRDAEVQRAEESAEPQPDGHREGCELAALIGAS